MQIKPPAKNLEPEIRTQLNTLIPPLASQLGWFTFSYKEQPQPYLLGAEMEN